MLIKAKSEARLKEVSDGLQGGHGAGKKCPVTREGTISAPRLMTESGRPLSELEACVRQLVNLWQFAEARYKFSF